MITLVLMLVVGVAAMNTQNNLLFWVFGMMTAVVAMSLVASYWMVRNLEIRRLDPKHGVVGEPLVVQYAIANRSRFMPVFNLFVVETARKGSANWRRFSLPASAWVMHIAPRETVHGETVFWPAARGELRFDHMRVSTTFPFGIVHRARKKRQLTHTLIFPRVHRLRRGVLEAIVPSGPMGMRLSNRPGGGDDYFGLREYKPGDSRRQIAWKRSASSQDLIIKERTMPSPPRLRIVLNLLTPTEELGRRASNGIDPRRLEERSISLAATLVEAAARQGYEVGVSVLGFDIQPTPLRTGHWHVEKIMAALASIELDAARLPLERRATPDAERAGMVAIHPATIESSRIPQAGWHFSAEQMAHLVERIGRADSSPEEYAGADRDTAPGRLARRDAHISPPQEAA